MKGAHTLFLLNAAFFEKSPDTIAHEWKQEWRVGFDVEVYRLLTMCENN